MDDVTIFNDAAVLVSAGASAVSAFFAGLAFLFSKRVSRLKSKGKGKSEYEKDKWMVLIPVALEELKKEGYKDLLGL